VAAKLTFKLGKISVLPSLKTDKMAFGQKYPRHSSVIF
jgi:hypothetical protein